MAPTKAKEVQSFRMTRSTQRSWSVCCFISFSNPSGVKRRLCLHHSFYSAVIQLIHFLFKPIFTLRIVFGCKNTFHNPYINTSTHSLRHGRGEGRRSDGGERAHNGREERQRHQTSRHHLLTGNYHHYLMDYELSIMYSFYFHFSVWWVVSYDLLLRFSTRVNDLKTI
jgi:hypothetical protein